MSDENEHRLDSVDPETHPARDARHFRAILAARGGSDTDLLNAVRAAREAGDGWVAIAVALDETVLHVKAQYGFLDDEPRPLKPVEEIIAHADEYSRMFEDWEPTPAEWAVAWRDIRALRLLRAAVRARSEVALVGGIWAARNAQYDWNTIGSELGVTGRIAKARYGHLADTDEDKLRRQLWEDSEYIERYDIGQQAGWDAAAAHAATAGPDDADAWLTLPPSERFPASYKRGFRSGWRDWFVMMTGN
ncbi:hypothetical protein [Prescottella equi]|uniref:hypothetical protein n=1 Tax=Rhodococcus hoagii TaxID=43767 RepID=UPI0015848508|nr:hypothetical protein [Prescottella equi]